jgi:hypothetical protein
MPGHPHILYTAVATPAVEGVTTILLLFLFMKIWDWDQDMLLIASVIPCIMTFSRLVDLLRSNLRLLRSLPLSRDCLAIIVMGCALASICIQVAAIALLRTLTLGFLPGLPVNFILLWMCPFAFFPFIAVFGRKWAALFVLPLFLAPAAIWTSLTESSTLQEYLALTPAPWFVLSSAICLIAAFFLLRYALLRPRLDWRYMREVQEMTARGSAT